MKEQRLILQGSVCQGSFVEGLDTVEEVRLNGDLIEDCRFLYDGCPMSAAAPETVCSPRMAQEVARHVVSSAVSLEEEMRAYRGFVESEPLPVNGYFDPFTQEPHEATTDIEEVLQSVEAWAAKILGIQPQDAKSLNREFREAPHQSLRAVFPVLEESVYDPTDSSWMHSCGSLLSVALVKHAVHMRSLPLAGSGRVVEEHRPFCPDCEQEPAAMGAILYEEDLDDDEMRILRDLLGGRDKE